MTIEFTAVASMVTAVALAIITYLLAKRREHLAEWRRVKFGQYQEYLLALSGIVEGRSTPEAQARYSDAMNSMYLVSPEPVLRALIEYQDEISCGNPERDRARHDKLLNLLLYAMRSDMLPGKAAIADGLQFHLITTPPKDNPVNRASQ